MEPTIAVTKTELHEAFLAWEIASRKEYPDYAVATAKVPAEETAKTNADYLWDELKAKCASL